jgi:hypothetical protein
LSHLIGIVVPALRTLTLAALAVLLTGCRLTLSVGIDVAPDAGGTLSVSVTSDAELEESAAAAGSDPLGRLADRVEALDGPWSVSDVTGDDGARTVDLTAPFADPAGFDALYADLRAALDAPEARLLGPMALERDPESGRMTVRGELPLELTEVAAADLGTDVAALTEQLAAVVESSLSVTTPGPLAADAAPSGIVTVEDAVVAPPYPDEPVTVTWVAVPGSAVPVDVAFEPGGTDLVRIALFGGGALLAVLLVLGGVVAQRRR